MHNHYEKLYLIDKKTGLTKNFRDKHNGDG